MIKFCALKNCSDYSLANTLSSNITAQSLVERLVVQDSVYHELDCEADTLNMSQVVPFVDCCVSLLERPDLLPGPLAQSRIVSVLLAFVNSDVKGRHSQ